MDPKIVEMFKQQVAVKAKLTGAARVKRTRKNKKALTRKNKNKRAY